MKLSRERLVFVLLCVLLLAACFGSMVGTVQAQDATDEPPGVDITTMPIPDDGSVVIVAPTADPVEVVRDTSTALGEIIAIFVSGAVVGGGGVLLALRSLIRSVNQNDALKLALERLYMSQPLQFRTGVRGGVETGKETFELLDELTDETLPDTRASQTGSQAHR